MENHNNSIVRTGDWMATMLIMAIPLVNIIMLFVWAFSAGEPASKSNWAKATLIWMLLGIALYVLAFIVFGSAIMAFANSY